jgi:hypothetical protein
MCCPAQCTPLVPSFSPPARPPLDLKTTDARRRGTAGRAGATPTVEERRAERARQIDLLRSPAHLAKLRETESTRTTTRSLLHRIPAIDVMRPRCSHDDPGLWRDREARQRQPSDDTPVSYLLCLVNFPDCD